MRPHPSRRAFAAVPALTMTLLAAPSTVHAATPPKAAVGNQIVLETSSDRYGGFADVSVVGAPDGTTWVAWDDTSTNNSYGGDDVIRLCWLPATATACKSIASYHDPLSMAGGAKRSVRDLRMSRTSDGTLWLVFASNPLGQPLNTQEDNVVNVARSTDSGQTITAPVQVGISPSPSAELDSAQVAAGYVDVVWDTFSTVFYDRLPVDGSTPAASPAVSWVLGNDGHAYGRASVTISDLGPVVATPEAEGDSDHRVGFASWHGGPLNAQSSWGPLTPIDHTDGFTATLTSKFGGGTYLATDGGRLVGPGDDEGQLLVRTKTGFAPIGPGIRDPHDPVVAEDFDGGVATLSRGAISATNSAELVGSGDLHHFTPPAAVATTGGPCSACDVALGLTRGGRGVAAWSKSITGAFQLVAQRVGRPPLATRTLTAKGKAGSLSATLVDGCVYDAKGKLPLALFETVVKAAGAPVPGVQLDGHGVKAPSKLPAAYSLDIGKLKPGSSHTVTVTARPAGKSGLPTLTLRIPITVCHSLPS